MGLVYLLLGCYIVLLIDLLVDVCRFVSLLVWMVAVGIWLFLIAGWVGFSGWMIALFGYFTVFAFTFACYL